MMENTSLPRRSGTNAEHLTAMKSIGDRLRQRAAHASKQSGSRRQQIDVPYPKFDGTQPCHSTDPEAFFPTQGNSTEENTMASRMCRECPFVADCYEYALCHDVNGIWGGTNHPFRQRERDRLNIAPVFVGISIA